MSEVSFARDSGLRQKLFAKAAMLHPAKLHIGWCMALVEEFTQPGQVLLDPMGGSGTLMVAALMGRHVLINELEWHFIAIARASWRKVQTLGPMQGHTMGQVSIIRGDARALPLRAGVDAYLHQREPHSPTALQYIVLFQPDNPIALAVQVAIPPAILDTLRLLGVPEVSIHFQDNVKMRQQEINVASANLSLPLKLQTCLQQLALHHCLKLRNSCFAIATEGTVNTTPISDTVRLHVEGFPTLFAFALDLGRAGLIEALSRAKVTGAALDMELAPMEQDATGWARDSLTILIRKGSAGVRAMLGSAETNFARPPIKRFAANRTLKSDTWHDSVHLTSPSIISYPSAIVTSPPYEQHHLGGHDKHPERQQGGLGGRIQRRYEDVSTIITSPPYEGVADATKNTNTNDAARGYPTRPMAYTQPSAVLTSPPYGEAQEGGGIAKHGYDGPKHGPTDMVGQRSYMPAVHGQATGNIGNMKGEAYWQAMSLVYKECLRVLRPGGVCIVVVKDFVRDRKVVPLVEDTLALLQQVGFVYQTRQVRHLRDQSFWRILQTTDRVVEEHGLQGALIGEAKPVRTIKRKRNDSPTVDTETALIMRKEET